MLNFYTAQYDYRGPDRLDITVKGQDPFGKYFAPTWPMLNKYREQVKINKITAEAEYIREYHSIIVKHIDQLYNLLDSTRIVLVCYCAPGTFCHRNILAHYLTSMGAIYKGEIKNLQNTSPITSFKGEHDWLSNFYLSPFTFQGITYPTNEHFYQAWKFPATERTRIAELATPGATKAEGRKAKLCHNWDQIKVEVMNTGLRLKFQSPLLRYKLLETHDRPLVEGNCWHDNFWGNCTCPRCINTPGKNMLGQLLMNIRKIP